MRDINLWCYNNARDVFLDCLDKLPSNDLKLLDQFIMDLKLEDYFYVNSSYNRILNLDHPKVLEYHFNVSLYIAYGLTKSEFIEKEIFNNNDFDPAEFINEASSFGVLSLNWNREFDKLFVAELKSVSFSRLLSQGVKGRKGNVCKIEFYDCLTTCSPRVISLCIKYIDTDEETKQILEKAIHIKDEDLFIDTLINSGADYSNVASILKAFLSIRPIMQTLPHVAEEASDEVSVLDVLCYPNSDDASIKELVSVKSIHDWKNSNDNKSYNIDWFILYSYLARHDYYYLSLHNIINNSCTDIDAVIKLSEFIQSNPNLRNAYERIESGELDALEARTPELDTLINFRSKFLDRLKLPKAINGNKGKDEYFDSVRDINKEHCIQFYYKLVEYELLSYDTDTFYAFVYRTDRKYIGEDTPQMIVWRGDDRELYCFVSWFVNDRIGKLRKKTVEFFIKPDGTHFKNNGVKNQGVNRTERMEKLIKELEAILSN